MIAAIGAFDGFHKGHRILLESARKLAEQTGIDWCTVTFERHPDSFLVSPDFKLLFVKRELVILEKFFSVPTSCRIEFTEEIARMSPDEFFGYISGEFGICGVVVGEGFRFGRNRMGTTEILKRECLKRGWVSEIVPVLRDEKGDIISSTSIRNAVASGNMSGVQEMLGYPIFYLNRVVHGNERGRKLGYPTANLEIPPEKIPPRKGVYATLALYRGKWYAGAANIGLNPTFGDVGGLRFEVNLQNFAGDLYGEEIAVFVLEYIREERHFENAEALKEQMRRDSAAVKETGGRFLKKNPELWKRFGEII
jgi:riboflavin kinase/FMN adenylyltransferase